jgi:23S rRNA (pseudouridine1915-N3)-methyltransferase
MSLHIIAIGKKHESWIQEGIERYQKRLKTPFNVEWILLPHSSLEGLSARQEESGRILSRLDAYTYVILLDERGKMVDSPEFSKLLEAQINTSQKIVLVIGGAYGVNEEIRNKASYTLSLSPLVFPHQLVRLLLVEQIYRAQEIAHGGAYHHD